MKKKRKPVKRIQPPKDVIHFQVESPPLHIDFPFTLHHKAENKLCFFKDEVHMQKYIDRCKLTSKDYKVTKTKPRKRDDPG